MYAIRSYYGLSLEDLALNFADGAPYLLQIWALIAGSLVITFLTLTVKSYYRRASLILVGFLFFGAYAMIFSIWPNDRHYQLLMAVHLPLLAFV